MPYIKRELREIVNNKIDELVKRLKEVDESQVDGVINYCFTKVLYRLYAENPNYFKLNRALGVLEAVKQEFYRRIISPYEDKKIRENGDIDL